MKPVQSPDCNSIDIHAGLKKCPGCMQGFILFIFYFFLFFSSLQNDGNRNVLKISSFLSVINAVTRHSEFNTLCFSYLD